MLPDPGDVFIDDPILLGPDQRVLRIINPLWVNWSDLDDQGRPRITNQAFQDFPEEWCVERGVPARSMSVGLEPVLENHGYTFEKMLEPWGERYGLAAMGAVQVRSCEQGIVGWEMELEPWHGLVFTLTGNKRTVGKQKCLARLAEWLIVPPQ